MNDGNFKAQNSHSARPDQDVCLYDGEGYMVAEEPYQDYLSKVPSKKEVCILGMAWETSVLILFSEIYM